jgi:glutaredoxin
LSGSQEATPQVVLFSRRRCHLCEAARQALDAAGIELREVDIDTDPVLQAEYGTTVPVVEVAGVPVFEAGMDPSTAAALVREEVEAARTRATRKPGWL